MSCDDGSYYDWLIIWMKLLSDYKLVLFNLSCKFVLFNLSFFGYTIGSYEAALRIYYYDVDFLIGAR